MRRLKNRYILRLNSSRWETIDKRIDSPSQHGYRVVITPVNEAFDDTFAGYGFTGFASMGPRLNDLQDNARRDQQKRATNLWHSRFTAETPQGAQVLFECFRSGTLAYPFADIDAVQRTEIAQAKAKELLTAMAARFIQREQALPEKARSINLKNLLEGKSTANIRVVSCNMQTAASRGGEAIAEVQSLSDHVAALRHWNGQNMKLDIRQAGVIHTISVKFDIAVFNFGVNAVAGRALSVLFGGKEFKEAVNGAAMNVLRQFHDEFQAGPAADATKAIARQLRERIESQNKCLDDTTYKTAAWVTNLAQLIGCMIHFNYKSVKDRTSMIAVESHFLAWKLHEAGVIPRGWELRGDDKDMHRKLVFESGNLEVQAHNTGIPGYKIAPINSLEPELVQRLGVYLKAAKGLCRLVKVKLNYTEDKFAGYEKLTPAECNEWARVIVGDE